MKHQRIKFLAAVLALTFLLLAACGEDEETIPTPALDLAAPASGAQVAFPTQIVVVIVTPTPDEGGEAAPPAEETPAGEEAAAAEETPVEDEAAAGETPTDEETAAAEETPEDEEAAGTGEAPASEDAGGQEQAAEEEGAAQISEEELISTGEQVYAANCASCHQESGEGTEAYPALTQSELLTAEDPSEAIQIVLHGRGEMPAFAGALSTEEIAAVLSYERNAWDNNAPAVTVAEVEQLQQGGTAAEEEAASAEEAPAEETPAEQEAAAAEETSAEEEAAAAEETPVEEEAAPVAETPAEEEAPAGEEGAIPSPQAEDAQAADASDEELLAMGRLVYATNCASCHQLSGQGTNVYPALAQSGLLATEDPGSAIAIVLFGRGEMPAFANLLSPEEIAAVLSYERNSWGNEAAVVTVEQVEEVQQAGAEPEADQTPTATAVSETTAQAATAATITATAETTPSPQATVAETSATVTATTTTVTGKATLAATMAITDTATPTETIAATRTITATAQTTPSPQATVTRTSAIVTATTPATATMTLTATAGATAGATARRAVTATAEVTPSPQTPESAAGTQTITATTTVTTTSAATSSPQAETTAASADEARASETIMSTPEEVDSEALISRGQRIYATNCASCHQLNGEGTAAYPPLAQSGVLTAEDPTEAIRVVLHGRGFMPAFANTLSAEEIAAVLSYERNAWDNNAPIVTVEEVEEAQ